jgi:hypothetical protein
VIAAAGAALLFAGAFIAAESIGETRHPPGFYYYPGAPTFFIPFGLVVGALGILGLYAGSRLGGWWQRREHISRIALALVGIASAAFVIIAGLAWGDSGCGGEELTALESIQPYDARYSRVGGSEGVCFVTFPAEHDRDEVVSYYTQELAAQGWMISGGGMGLLYAERGDLRFQLIHSGSFGGSNPDLRFFEIIVSSPTNVDPEV